MLLEFSYFLGFHPVSFSGTLPIEPRLGLSCGALQAPSPDEADAGRCRRRERYAFVSWQGAKMEERKQRRRYARPFLSTITELIMLRDAANALWDSLDSVNRSLANTLLKLSELAEQSPDEYSRVVKYLASLQSVQWLAHPSIPPTEFEVIEAFTEAHQRSEVRHVIRLPHWIRTEW